ncbi:nuclear transport factor 2 family protein [Microvirga sp. VF16]|uniref:nuclear transport factor 2 family protein n=1 Tax=Microvirga sp. VF16 TaxID=2807101 RepID=UPI00193DB70B|nr:nuclear transport factor 2 family protein [Microvirga sp. VF16]QRM29350.1 nuclear transport factor 2 family protein [Microvirga sp. VF16]
MPAQNDHVSILREAYTQWVDSRGSDCECWMNIIADDVSLGSLADGSPEVPFTARRDNRSGVRAYLEDLMRDWEMISHAMDEFIAQDDRVAVVGRAIWRHKGTGKVADTRKVDIWRFRDGKVIDFDEYYDTARLIAAATP